RGSGARSRARPRHRARRARVDPPRRARSALAAAGTQARAHAGARARAAADRGRSHRDQVVLLGHGGGHRRERGGRHRDRDQGRARRSARRARGVHGRPRLAGLRRAALLMSRGPGPVTLALALAMACGEEPPAPSVAVVDGGSSSAWAHAVGFEGGIRLDGIVAPDSVEPGQTLRVDVTLHGPVDGLRARVIAWPPRAGSRQVALGGVGAPPVEVPLDPRAVVIEVPLAEGAHALELPLPTPWHPSQVLVTLELLRGDDRIPAVAGPRREDGRALLALV